MDLLLVADQKVEPGWICGPEGLQKPQDRCLWTREKTNEKWQYRFFRSKEIKEMIKTNPQLLRAPWIDQIPNLNLDNFLLLLVYRKVEVKVGSRRREAHVKTLSVGPAAHLLFRSMLYTGSHIIDELERIVDTAIKTKFHIYDTFNTLGKFAKIVYLGENTYRQTTYEAFRLILKHVLSTDSAHVPILAHIIFPPPVPEICSAMDTNAQEQSSRRQNIDRNSLELNPELTEEGRGGGSLTYSRTNRSAVNSEHETRAPHTDTTSRGESGSEGTKGLSQSRDQIATTNITGDNKETHKSADVPQAVPLSTHHTCEDILPQVHTSKTKNIDKMQNTSVTYRECRELLKTLHLIDGDHPPKSLELSSTRTTPSSPDADSATSSTNRPALPISRNTQNSSTSLSHPNVSQHPGRVISHADPTQSFTGATSCSSATITDSYLDEPLGLAASASVTRITNSDKDSRVNTSARCAETKNNTSILPLSERVDTSAQATRTTNSAEDSETTTSSARVEPVTSILGTNTSICDSLKPEFLHPATPTASYSAKKDKCGIRRKIFGTVSSATKSRTLLLLGAKGSGKTCLINAVANFISGGKSDTEKKLTVSDEVAETGFASTDNITGYTFVFKDQEENVALTLIDTPGMNDSSGNEVRDHVESLKMFLTNAKHKGLEIHCIAFVVQAHLVRLTSSERLVMDNMKTLFGQDVSDHMVNLITFADNQKPPVVEALNHYGLSTRHCFIFNNSVFCGSSEESEELDRIYWKISHKSWKKCWKVVRDLSPLTTNTMVSIQKEIYATSRQDIAMRELQAEINGLLQLCRGPYNSKVEKGRQRVWDAARVAFQILRTTGNGRYPSLWSLIEDTVPKKYGFEQARKVSHFLLVGTSIQLKDTIVAILRSNVVLQGQLIRMENLTKSRLRQPIHTLKNMQLAYSDPKINLDILPPIKTLVIKNTAIILSKLINDNSNNCITQNGIVKYLKSLLKEMDLSMCIMIKDVCEYLDG